MEGIKFTNELVEAIFRSYPRFKVRRWVYGDKYIAIENEAGNVGLTLADDIIKKVWRDPDNILHKLDEMDPNDLVFLLQHPNPVYKYVGHAYINSLTNNPSLLKSVEEDPLDILLNSELNKIVFVGYIAPTIRKFRDAGFEVYTIEANLDMISEDIRVKEEVYPWWSYEELLVDADAVIITGSSIPNNTIGRILCSSANAKFKIVVGPSTTLIPEVFRRYKVTYLGGSIVIDNNMVFKYLSEGGGFHMLERSKAIQKVTIKII